MPTQELRQLRELLASIDERRRRRWNVAAALGSDRDRGDRRVVHEDRLLKAAQLRAGLEREPLAQQASRLLSQDAPAAWIYYDANPVLEKPWVKNFYLTSLGFEEARWTDPYVTKKS